MWDINESVLMCIKEGRWNWVTQNENPDLKKIKAKTCASKEIKNSNNNKNLAR